jgi:hypothetical protein
LGWGRADGPNLRARRRRLPGLARVVLGSHNYKHIICHPTMAPAEPVVRFSEIGLGTHPPSAARRRPDVGRAPGGRHAYRVTSRSRWVPFTTIAPFWLSGARRAEREGLAAGCRRCLPGHLSDWSDGGHERSPSDNGIPRCVGKESRTGCLPLTHAACYSVCRWCRASAFPFRQSYDPGDTSNLRRAGNAVRHIIVAALGMRDVSRPTALVRRSSPTIWL